MPTDETFKLEIRTSEAVEAEDLRKALEPEEVNRRSGVQVDTVTPLWVRGVFSPEFWWALGLSFPIGFTSSALAGWVTGTLAKQTPNAPAKLAVILNSREYNLQSEQDVQDLIADLDQILVSLRKGKDETPPQD